MATTPQLQTRCRKQELEEDYHPKLVEPDN